MTNPLRKRAVSFVVIAAAFCAAIGVTPGTAQPPVPPLSLHVEVTGDPAPTETLRLAIATAIRKAIPTARDAEISLTSATPPLVPLPAASEITLVAEVRVAAPGGAPVTYTVSVTVTNAILPWSDAQVLLVSNSPETLAFSKVLYNSTLGVSQPARLLYHHQNGSTREMYITVTLSNPTPMPITVWAAGANGGPGSDELAVGHEAARRFLDQYWHHAGFLLQIPANTTLPVFFRAVPPQAIISGLTQLSLIDGEHLNLQVAARVAGTPDPPPISFTPVADPLHTRGAFARPQIVQAITYIVGGPPVVITVGADADLVHDDHSGQTLQGNYGVLYTFRVEVTNPTPAPAALALVMHADGGLARGTFLLDDRIVEGPVVLPGSPQRLATVHVGPLESRTFLLATMPESGANYPVRLTLAPQGTR